MSTSFNKPKKSQSGSILLESLISVLIFMIAVIGLMGVAATSQNQIGQSKARNDASYLVGEVIGEMWVAADTPQLFDNAPWTARVASVLPDGRVDTWSVDGNKIEIDISWADNKNAGERHHYATTAEIARNN